MNIKLEIKDSLSIIAFMQTLIDNNIISRWDKVTDTKYLISFEDKKTN